MKETKLFDGELEELYNKTKESFKKIGVFKKNN